MSRNVPAYRYASPFDRKNDGEQIPVLTYSIQTNVFRRRHDSTLGKVPTCVARRLNSRFIRSIRFEVVIIRIGISLKFINVKVSITDILSFLDAFDQFKAKWENGHSKAVKVWTEQFKYVEQLFNYPVEIRRVIYTTNTIESVNSALRKVTNLKGALPSEDALSKLLYLRIQNLLKTWKGPVRFWTDIKKKLDICCPGWNELRAK